MSPTTSHRTITSPSLSDMCIRSPPGTEVPPNVPRQSRRWRRCGARWRPSGEKCQRRAQCQGPCQRRSAARGCSASGLGKQCFWLLYAEYTGGKVANITLLRYVGKLPSPSHAKVFSLHHRRYRMRPQAMVWLCRENTYASMLPGGKQRLRGKTPGGTARFDRLPACRRERLARCSTCHRSLRSHTEYARKP